MALTRVNSKLLGGSFSVDSSGGLNIDSNTLVVDAGNNRVGIVTASPTVALDVTGALKTSTDSTINGLTVGIGGGSACTTSANVAIHYPMASLIRECKDLSYGVDKPTKIIADGGFKNFSDIFVHMFKATLKKFSQ